MSLRTGVAAGCIAILWISGTCFGQDASAKDDPLSDRGETREKPGTDRQFPHFVRR